ncbi:MAG: hypothetical protein ACOY9Y_15450 [Bacillota bacterium]
MSYCWKEVIALTKPRVSKAVFDSLVGHLVDLEEDWSKHLSEFLPEIHADSKIAQERREMESLFRQYIKNLDRLVTSVEVKDESGNALPFVTIGSLVHLRAFQIARLCYW